MSDREVCEHFKRINDPCEDCGTARNSIPNHHIMKIQEQGTEMTEKRAKKLKKEMNGTQSLGRSYLSAQAIGYLEALKKAKILEKALKTILDFVDGELGEDAKKALAQWRKIK